MSVVAEENCSVESGDWSRARTISRCVQVCCIGHASARTSRSTVTRKVGRFARKNQTATKYLINFTAAFIGSEYLVSVFWSEYMRSKVKIMPNILHLLVSQISRKGGTRVGALGHAEVAGMLRGFLISRRTIRCVHSRSFFPPPPIPKLQAQALYPHMFLDLPPPLALSPSP